MVALVIVGREAMTKEAGENRLYFNAQRRESFQRQLCGAFEGDIDQLLEEHTRIPKDNRYLDHLAYMRERNAKRRTSTTPAGEPAVRVSTSPVMESISAPVASASSRNAPLDPPFPAANGDEFMIPEVKSPSADEARDMILQADAPSADEARVMNLQADTPTDEADRVMILQADAPTDEADRVIVVKKMKLSQAKTTGKPLRVKNTKTKKVRKMKGQTELNKFFAKA